MSVEKEIEINTSCMICGLKEWRVFSEIENGKYRVCICKKCSFTQLYPIPTQDALDAFYSKQYRNDYSDNSKVTDDVLVYEQKRADRVIKVIKPYFKNESKNILDIGCSSGTLLENIAKLSKSATLYGIEMNEEYKSYIIGKGIVEEDKLSSENINSFYKGQENKFDFISIVHVLEHLKDPKAALESIYRLLDFNGLLYIEVPNLKTPYNDLKKEYFAIYHLFYFTEYTLGRLLRGVGFKILYQEQIAGTSVCFVCQKNKIEKEVAFQEDTSSMQYPLLIKILKKYEKSYPIKKYVLKFKGYVVTLLEYLKIKEFVKNIVER
jgi:2-polyprenyl-3-methyl-5-hydroxy-6-metoxy-1,4-benzoquinol methylase